jgi:hypothetical protein
LGGVRADFLMHSLIRQHTSAYVSIRASGRADFLMHSLLLFLDVC